MGIADYIKNKLPFWPNWINYILLKCNILGASIYGTSYKRMLKQIGNVNPEKQLIDSTNYALEHVPYYKKKYGTLRITNKKEFEEKIGFIDKTEVMTHWNDFLSDEIDMTKVGSGTTGGTSGKPLKLLYPKNRYVYSLAFIHHIWKRFGWNYEVRGVFRNHHIKSNRDFIISPFLKELIFDTFRMDETYAKKCWEILRKYHIHYIHAYPSSFFQFCKLCYQQNLDLSFIRTAFLGSEGITGEQQVLFHRMNIQICSWYGHSECLILAGNLCNSNSYKIEENYGYCELIEQDHSIISKTNTEGELVGTTFFNKYFPLIRYKTGDYSMYAPNETTNEKQRLLSTILGHWDKNIIYKNDGTYTTTTALNLHNDIYDHIDGLQYIQEEIGKLIVCIIKNNNYTKDDEIRLINHFANAMGGAENVNLKYVSTLIFEANHKFSPLISNIKK